MRANKNLSQRERTARHKESNPLSEKERKETQRAKERSIRFWIVRAHLRGDELPDWIDTDSAMYKRVLESYQEQCEEDVVRVEHSVIDAEVLSNEQKELDGKLSGGV